MPDTAWKPMTSERSGAQTKMSRPKVWMRTKARYLALVCVEQNGQDIGYAACRFTPLVTSRGRVWGGNERGCGYDMSCSMVIGSRCLYRREEPACKQPQMIIRLQ
jgi:hypothetical protein